jgi:CDP-glucose 4,6-dehydratase
MFQNIYKGKKVLITGHTGFKGSWLTMWLLNLGADVVGLSINIPTDPSIFITHKLEKDITDYRVDVRDVTRIDKIINEERPDFIFHLAAQPIVSVSYLDPFDTISTNIMGLVSILDAVRKFSHKCAVVIITSDKCYDNVEWIWGYKETDQMGGKDIYSASKGCAELIYNSYYHSFFKNTKNIFIASARAGNVIGGGDWAKDRIVPDCMISWSKNQTVEIRSPNSTRPWQHVLEPLSGYLLLGQQLYSEELFHGESFNFGPASDQTRKVIELIDDLTKFWSFESTFSSYTITRNSLFHEASLLKLNCDKALFYLKWLPNLNYETLISFTSKWYYNYYTNPNEIKSYTINQIKEYERIAKQNNLIWTR